MKWLHFLFFPFHKLPLQDQRRKHYSHQLSCKMRHTASETWTKKSLALNLVMNGVRTFKHYGSAWNSFNSNFKSKYALLNLTMSSYNPFPSLARVVRSQPLTFIFSFMPNRWLIGKFCRINFPILKWAYVVMYVMVWLYKLSV